MSQELIDGLQSQIVQLKNANAALMAQFDAAKQMFNDSIASCLQLRTTAVLEKNNVQDHINKLVEKDKVIEALNLQLSDAAAKINLLEANLPKNEPLAE